MPRSPNLKNPLANVRTALGLSVVDFAALVGHGAEMIRKVESGGKKMPVHLAEKVHSATGVSIDYLLGRTTEVGTIDLVGSRGFDDHYPPRTLRTFASVLALYCAATEAGMNAELVLTALEREIDRFSDRWSVDLQKVNQYAAEITQAIFPRGKADAPGNEFLATLATTAAMTNASSANDRTTKAYLARERKVGSEQAMREAAEPPNA